MKLYFLLYGLSRQLVEMQILQCAVQIYELQNKKVIIDFGWTNACIVIEEFNGHNLFVKFTQSQSQILLCYLIRSNVFTNKRKLLFICLRTGISVYIWVWTFDVKSHLHQHFLDKSHKFYSVKLARCCSKRMFALLIAKQVSNLFAQLIRLIQFSRFNVDEKFDSELYLFIYIQKWKFNFNYVRLLTKFGIEYSWWRIKLNLRREATMWSFYETKKSNT